MHSPFLRWQFQNSARTENSAGKVKIGHFETQRWRKNDSIVAMIIAERVYDDHFADVGETKFRMIDF